jgi:plastocyanin
MNRRAFCLAFVLMLLSGGLLAPRAAVAGGWAVVELTKPVPVAVVGKPVTISFRVLQHGQPEAAVAGLDPVVTLMHRESRDRTTVTATATKDDPTIYEAALTLKKTGAYKWNITPGPFSATAMPTLTVFRTAAEAKRAKVAEAPEAGAAVTILEGSYSPSRLVVAPGTTVEWTNESVLPHQVVWSGLDLDDSAILASEGTFRVTFDEEGTFTYYCGPHPYMTGEIVVSKAAGR